MGKDLDYICRHAYASAPPSQHVNLGRPPRPLSRCPDEELRRRGYGFIGRWHKPEALTIAEYLRGRGCVVVLKRGHGTMNELRLTVWAKRIDEAKQ